MDLGRAAMTLPVPLHTARESVALAQRASPLAADPASIQTVFEAFAPALR